MVHKMKSGINVSGAKVRVTVLYSKDDDLGLDKDTSDAVYINVERDPKDPKKIKFANFTS